MVRVVLFLFLLVLPKLCVWCAEQEKKNREHKMDDKRREKKREMVVAGGIKRRKLKREGYRKERT